MKVYKKLQKYRNNNIKINKKTKRQKKYNGKHKKNIMTVKLR